MVIEENTLIQAREDVAWRQIEEEVIIVDGRYDKVHTLNPVATVIWNRIQEGITFGDLTAELLAEFDIDSETLLQDVKELIGQFHSCKLLTIVNP